MWIQTLTPDSNSKTVSENNPCSLSWPDVIATSKSSNPIGHPHDRLSSQHGPCRLDGWDMPGRLIHLNPITQPIWASQPRPCDPCRLDGLVRQAGTRFHLNPMAQLIPTSLNGLIRRLIHLNSIARLCTTAPAWTSPSPSHGPHCRTRMDLAGGPTVGQAWDLPTDSLVVWMPQAGLWRREIHQSNLN